MKTISIIFITILFISAVTKIAGRESSKDFKNFSNNKLILLMGPTRAGKSCFINTITGKNYSVVGDDSGDSTTKEYEIYESEIDGFPDDERFKLIDTMGLDDSDESGLGDPIILASIIYHLKNEMENSSTSLQSIYLFESLTNDANQILKTIKKLKAVFGDDIVYNVIVVFNKNPKPNIKRMTLLKKQIKSEGIRNYIHWLSGCGANALSDDYYVQMDDLYGFTTLPKPITFANIKEIANELETEGRKIFENNKENIVKKFRSYYQYGSIALSLFSMIDVTSLVVSNLAVQGLDYFYSNLMLNGRFLMSLGIEARMKAKFKSKSDL